MPWRHWVFHVASSSHQELWPAWRCLTVWTQSSLFGISGYGHWGNISQVKHQIFISRANVSINMGAQYPFVPSRGTFSLFYSLVSRLVKDYILDTVSSEIQTGGHCQSDQTWVGGGWLRVVVRWRWSHGTPIPKGRNGSWRRRSGSNRITLALVSGEQSIRWDSENQLEILCKFSSPFLFNDYSSLEVFFCFEIKLMISFLPHLESMVWLRGVERMKRPLIDLDILL